MLVGVGQDFLQAAAVLELPWSPQARSWGLPMMQLKLGPAESSSFNGSPDAAAWFLHRPETGLLRECGGRGNEERDRKEWSEEGTMIN